jgi:hypothetical protein
MKTEVTKKVPMLSKNVEWIQHHGGLQHMRIKLSDEPRAFEIEAVPREEFDRLVAGDAYQADFPFQRGRGSRVVRPVADDNDSQWKPRDLD